MGLITDDFIRANYTDDLNRLMAKNKLILGHADEDEFLFSLAKKYCGDDKFFGYIAHVKDFLKFDFNDITQEYMILQRHFNNDSDILGTLDSVVITVNTGIPVRINDKGIKVNKEFTDYDFTRSFGVCFISDSHFGSDFESSRVNCASYKLANIGVSGSFTITDVPPYHIQDKDVCITPNVRCNIDSCFNNAELNKVIIGDYCVLSSSFMDCTIDYLELDVVDIDYLSFLRTRINKFRIKRCSDALNHLRARLRYFGGTEIV